MHSIEMFTNDSHFKFNLIGFFAEIYEIPKNWAGETHLSVIVANIEKKKEMVWRCKEAFDSCSDRQRWRLAHNFEITLELCDNFKELMFELGDNRGNTNSFN